MPNNATRVAFVDTIERATAARTVAATPPARFAFPVPDSRDTAAVAAEVQTALAPLGAVVTALSPVSPRDLVLTLPQRVFTDPTAAFNAAHAIETAFDLPVVEPEIFHGVTPIDPALVTEPTMLEGIEKFPPGCWVDAEERIEQQKDWVLARMRVREAWDFAQARGRPSKGSGVVIAQPDTGITAHAELHGIDQAGAFNLLDPARPRDATDPLGDDGNPGHGTATASVVVSPEAGTVIGSAPLARHMPIRAIESVVRLSQVKVAEAIDRAVDAGAHVITMSLGGIFSISLQRALARAVQANVIVLAAAGNCVRLVVWPARFDDCIAVAGTDFDDAVWQGSCRGPDVDVAAPAQNVYRASVGATPAGQGQGTSFAVALTAGAAACWLAYHGRAHAIEEAHRRGETLQAMFRRLLKATARRPAGAWDEFSMGTGVVDALALLQASFDAGRETEGPLAVLPPLPPERSVRGFALETVGSDALNQVDWLRHGSEVSLAVLQARAQGRAVDLESGIAAEGTMASLALRTELPAELRVHLGLTAAEPVAAPAAPAVHRAPVEPPSPSVAERIRVQRRILAGREAAERRGALESAPIIEESLPADAPVPHPDDVLARIDRLIQAMPLAEIGDPDAFRQAVELLHRYGDPALRKLSDPLAAAAATVDDASALEAMVMADGSRPSFLLKDGLPPDDHPFMGTWRDNVVAFRHHVQKAAKAVGRVQPTGGHASRFVGTASLVDRDKKLALTNYHVLDDARVKLGVPMTQNDRRVTVHKDLEVDFIGEADNLATNRFKVVEALLPEGYGRGFGRVDAAVLRLEPVNDRSVLPAAAAALSSNAAFVTGDADRLPSLCTIGFPGPPPLTAGKTGEVDWAFVTATLFGNRFGFKRLAPGTFHKSLGSDPRDTINIVFGHNASTFGGASGSLIVAWRDDGPPSFGLHFGGATENANFAISVAAAVDALRAIGVPIE